MNEKSMRKYVEMFEPEGEPVYNRQKVSTYFKFGLIIVAITSIILNQRLSVPGLRSHFQTAIVSVLATKTWYLIPDYLDIAQENGLVYELGEDGGKIYG